MSSATTPTLAAVIGGGNGEGDRFLSDVARQLIGMGVKVGGVVQSNPLEPGQCRCSMVLEELTTGTHIPISQNLGRDSRGCRLDAGALEFAASLVETSIARGLDMLVLNKFGRGEAEGRGFRQAIALAVESEIPVLIGVNKANLSAWQEFTGGECVLLEADQSFVASWLAEHLECARSDRRDPITLGLTTHCAS